MEEEKLLQYLDWLQKSKILLSIILKNLASRRLSELIYIVSINKKLTFTILFSISFYIFLCAKITRGPYCFDNQTVFQQIASRLMYKQNPS